MNWKQKFNCTPPVGGAGNRHSVWGTAPPLKTVTGLACVTWFMGSSEDAEPLTGWTETWTKWREKPRLGSASQWLSKRARLCLWAFPAPHSATVTRDAQSSQFSDEKEQTSQETALLLTISSWGLLTFLFFWNSVLASFNMYCFSLMVSSICPDAACHFLASLKILR